MELASFWWFLMVTWRMIFLWLIFRISFWLIKKAISCKQLRKIPHRKSNFILGDTTVHLEKRPGESDLKRRMRIVFEFYDEFHPKKVAVFWNLWQPFILVYHWEAIGKVLANKNLLLKDYIYLKPWIGEGLLTSESTKWHARRKLLTPSFYLKTLEDFVPTIFRLTKESLDKWAVNSPQVIDINTTMSRFTLDVLFETVMGLPPDALLDSRDEFIAAVKKLGELVPTRSQKLLARFDLTYKFTTEGKEYYAAIKTLHEFSRKAIELRIKHFRQLDMEENRELIESMYESVYTSPNKRIKSFMDTLIRVYLNRSNPTVKNLKDIQEEVDTFMFAGHDTTATAIMWTVFLLGCNTDIQEKLHDELLETFGNNPQHFDQATLSTQKYLDACVKESMRLISPVPAIAKKLTEDINVCGYKVPKSSTVVLELFFMHRDPNLYSEPLKFDPNRFLDKNLEGKPYSFAPFSAGPRNCIGQKFALLEMKIFIALLVLKFKFRSLIKFEDIEYLFEIVTRTKQIINVEFTRRD